MVYLQDGAEFFHPLREWIRVTLMEEGVKHNVELITFWTTCELMETVYNLCVEGHIRDSDSEKIFSKIQSKWSELERVFHAVFRVPVATWLDTHIELRIEGRDLYLSPYKEP